MLSQHWWNVVIILLCIIWIDTFSTIFRSVLMLRIHQPTPTALSSDHCGSPLCMAGIMFNSSSSASEWKAHAKWHVDRPAVEEGGREDSDWGAFCKSHHRINEWGHIYLGGAAACGTMGAEKWAGRYEGAWPAGISTHIHREPLHLHEVRWCSVVTFIPATILSQNGGQGHLLCIICVHDAAADCRLWVPVPELEPSYPHCAYLALEQPANVFFSD